MFQRLLVTLLLLALCATATAEFIGPGSKSTHTTVSEVKGMKDDIRVTLVGTLVNQVAEEFYTFQDETGQMVVQIDHDELRGMTVTPDTRIILRGETDDDDHDSLVDVDFVELEK